MKKIIFIICLLFILNQKNLLKANWVVTEEKEIITTKNYQEVIPFLENDNLLILINHQQIYITYNRETVLVIEGIYNTSKIINNNIYIITNYNVYKIEISNFNYTKYTHHLEKVNDIIYNYNIYLIGMKNDDACIYEYDKDFNLYNKYLYGGNSKEQFTKGIYYNEKYYLIGLKDAHSLNSPFNNVGNKGDTKSFITVLNENFEIINSYYFNQLEKIENVNSFHIVNDIIHILLVTEDQAYKYKLTLNFDLIELYNLRMEYIDIYETISMNKEYDNHDIFIIRQEDKLVLYVYNKGVVVNDYQFKNKGIVKSYYIKEGCLYIYLTTTSGLSKITITEYVDNKNDDLIVNRLNNDYNSTNHINVISYLEDLSFVRYESDPYFLPNINGTYEVIYRCIRLNQNEIYTTSNIIVEPYINIYNNGIYPTNINLLFFGIGYLNDQKITSGEIINQSGHYVLKIIDCNDNIQIYEFDCIDNYYKETEVINIPSIIEINKNESYDFIIDVNKDVSDIYVNSEKYDFKINNNKYTLSFNSSLYNQIDSYNINYITYYEKNILKRYLINDAILLRTLKTMPIIDIYEYQEINDLVLDINILDPDRTLSYIQIDLIENNHIIETYKNYFTQETISFNQITINKPYTIKTSLVYELGGIQTYTFPISSINVTFNKYNQEHIILSTKIEDNKITNIKITNLSKKITFNEILLGNVNLSEKYQKTNDNTYLFVSITISIVFIVVSIFIFIYRKRKL